MAQYCTPPKAKVTSQSRVFFSSDSPKSWQCTDNDLPSLSSKVTLIGGDEHSRDWYSSYGTYTDPDGSKYSGYWKDDLPHGAGEEQLPDGSLYKGEF